MAEYFDKGSINGIKTGDFKTIKEPMGKINSTFKQEEARMDKAQKLTPDDIDEFESEDDNKPSTQATKTVRKMKSSAAKMGLGGKKKIKLEETVDKDGKVC